MLHTLPIEILDEIFIYLDHNSIIQTKLLVKTQIHSEWILKLTENNNYELAIRKGNVENVKWLNKYCKDVKITDKCISYALRQGNYDILKYLVDININFSNYLSHDIFNISNNEMTCKILKLFLETKKILFSGFNYNDAAHNNNLEAMKLLHSYKIKMSCYVVVIAARNNNFKCVNWLIENGGEVNDMCIIESASHGHFEMVKFFHYKHGLRLSKHTFFKAIDSGNIQLISFIKEILGETLVIIPYDLKMILVWNNDKVLEWIMENFNVYDILSDDTPGIIKIRNMFRKKKQQMKRKRKRQVYV